MESTVECGHVFFKVFSFQPCLIEVFNVQLIQRVTLPTQGGGCKCWAFELILKV